jgi:hypothetical protein
MFDLTREQQVLAITVAGVAGAVLFYQLNRPRQRALAKQAATHETTKWFELKLTDYAPHILVRSKVTQWLQAHPLDSCCPLNLVMIFGPARQGKSFLMNVLTGEEDLFAQSGRVEPCTCGVDLSNFFPTVSHFKERGLSKAEEGFWSLWSSRKSEATKKDAYTPQELAMQALETRVGFVDVEGQGDRDETYDTLLATPILLCSQVVLFNWMGGVGDLSPIPCTSFSHPCSFA